MVQTSRFVPVCNRTDLQVQWGNVTVIYGTTSPIWISVCVTSCTLRLACSLSRTTAECRVGSVVANITSQIFQHAWKVWLKEIWSLKPISTFRKKKLNWTPIQTNTRVQMIQIMLGYYILSLVILTSFIFIMLLVSPASFSRALCLFCATTKESQNLSTFQAGAGALFLFPDIHYIFLSPVNHVMQQHLPRSDVLMSIITQLIYQDIIFIETRRTYSNYLQ